MVRFFLVMGVVAFLLPACSSQPEPEPAPPPPPAKPKIPPAPAFVDVLPEFKKSAREFLDLARKLDTAAGANPPPSYATFKIEMQPLEDIYAKVIDKEPKTGHGANAFQRINNLRDSLLKTQSLLKNKENYKTSKVMQLLEAEAAKRKLDFDEGEFFWKQTPDATKRD
jgi:hypothetical protein